jgi:hypothetical protein
MHPSVEWPFAGLAPLALLHYLIEQYFSAD